MPKIVRCPICRKEITWEGNSFRPFCSERCRTRDLSHWATGQYALPGEKVSISDEFTSEEEAPTEKKD